MCVQYSVRWCECGCEKRAEQRIAMEGYRSEAVRAREQGTSKRGVSKSAQSEEREAEASQAQSDGGDGGDGGGVDECRD